MIARLRYDRVEFDRASMREAADGSLVIRGRFARTGLQTYHDGNGGERIEFRSDAEVKASAATFEGKGLTDLHPGTMVSPDNWASVGRGHLQDVTYIAPKSDADEGWLEADFHVKARDLIDAIKRGDRRELSAGYYADEDPTPGTYRGQRYHSRQVGIVANHVAVLPHGTARAGRGARLLLDASGNQLPPGRGLAGEEMNMDETETKGELIAQRSRADSEAAKAVVLAQERDAAKAKADALTAEVEDLKAKLAEATSQARLDALVAARATLVERVRRLGGSDIDLSGSELELKCRALDAAGVKLDDEQRKSAAYVDARMDAAIERLQEIEDSGEITLRDALDRVTRGQATTKADPLQMVWDARDRARAQMTGEEE